MTHIAQSHTYTDAARRSRSRRNGLMGQDGTPQGVMCSIAILFAGSLSERGKIHQSCESQLGALLLSL